MIGTIVVGAIAAVVSIGLLMGGAAVAFTYIRNSAPVQSGPPEALQLRVAELELKIEGMPSLWEEERKRAKRAHQAAESARRLADEKLEEIEEIIAENGSVPVEHEERGEEQRVLPLRKNMGVAPQEGIEERFHAIEHLLK